MKANLRNSVALVALALSGPAAADIIYSNLQDVAIPTGNWTGVTVTVNGGNINPFFGGVGVANDALFQPARNGTDPLATLLKLPVGTTIDVSNSTLKFATGAGGSEDHLGTTFSPGTQGYLGFNSNGKYGWMRVVFTYDTAGAVIKDWAYDNSVSGGSIIVGRVQENVVDPTHNLVTLSPQGSETFTLGSVLANASGKTNSVLKTEAGTTILTATNTYGGNTLVSQGTLALSGSGAIASSPVIAVQSGATLDVGGVTGGWTVGSSNAQTLTGAGGVTGATTIGSFGTHNAGDATVNSGVGTQNFSGALNYAAGSIFEWDLNANSTSTGFDRVGAGDQITVDPDSTVFKIVLGTNVDMSDAFWSTPYISQTWAMASIFGTSFSGAFQFVQTSYNVSQYGRFTISGTDLVFTAVPEPTNALVGLLLGAALMRRRR
ncbi:MAG: autotransporter-associated beta strand repeat-containing protein [Verrucomicrobia bacterium]|nr:autotransporter-associated beta strand repeat-containing protein [Verrucomicrobiota bacterium]